MKNLTDHELYKKCVDCSFMIKKYRNEFIGLLPEVALRKLYLKHGMHSIYEFAAKLAGLSNGTVSKILNIKTKLQNKPILNAMFEGGEIGWSKLEVIAPIVTLENEKELAIKIQTMSQASLEVMVRDYRTQNMDSSVDGSYHDSTKAYSNEFEKFSAKLDPKLISQLRVLHHKLEKKAHKPLTWNETFKEILNIVEDAITPKERKSKTVKTQSRYIPAAKKREAFQKTAQLCAKESCNKPAEHLHHQSPYSISKSHESIVPLCKAHHDIEHHKEQTYINQKYQEYKRVVMQR